MAEIEGTIERIINNGSIYEAIYSDMLRINAILQYLLWIERKSEIQDKAKLRMLAVVYRIVCHFDYKQQMRSCENYSFIKLTNNKYYIAIHSVLFPNITDIE